MEIQEFIAKTCKIHRDSVIHTILRRDKNKPQNESFEEVSLSVSPNYGTQRRLDGKWKTLAPESGLEWTFTAAYACGGPKSRKQTPEFLPLFLQVGEETWKYK
jgi:hypothetical protein